MLLYSYVVRSDSGFAPNPFYGWCTLATCKPRIRGHASVGDWIVGTSSKSTGLPPRLVYAMRVEEKLTFDAYWNDPRFQRKKPDQHGSRQRRCGDNIYHWNSKGWQQAPSHHSLEGGAPNPDNIAHDTSHDAVLCSQHFSYWGGTGPDIPTRFRNWDGVDLQATRNHKSASFPDDMRTAVVVWIESLAHGCQGDPLAWATGVCRPDCSARRC